MIIRAKIDVLKINKDHIFQGDKGKYIDITLLENKNGPDQFGNDFMVVQDLGKEARERGEKGPILGNGKFVGQRPASPQPTPTTGPQPTRPPAQTTRPPAQTRPAPGDAPAAAPADDLPW